MKAKKIISMLLTLIMLTGMFSAFSISSTAAGVSLPANTVIVKLGATATDTSATYNGTEYTGLVYGTTLFAKIQDAINAAKDGDTVLLCAGKYEEEVYVSKSVTIKGAKAGVDPNSGEASETEEKTLTPGRSLTDATVETIVTTKDWYLGYSAANTLVAADTTAITVDGVVFSADGGMVSLIQDQAKTLNLSVKNCIAVDVYNSFVYTCNSGSASAGSYVRNLSFENVRFEKYARAYSYVFLRQNADSFILDNVYFAATCTSARSQIISGWEISSRATSAEFTVKNSTFMINGKQACFVDPALQFKSTSISLSNLSNIKISVENCKFVGSPNNTVFRPQFSQEPNNVEITFFGNTVVDCTKPIIWQNTGKKIAPARYKIDNNTFIDCTGANVSNLYVTDGTKATATKTLCIANGEVVIPKGDDKTVNFASYYKDADKKVLVGAGDKISLVGVQQRMNGEKFDVRAVSVLNFAELDKYVRVGYKVSVKKNGTLIVDAKEISGTSVYTDIWAGEDLVSADGLASDYIVALSIKNFDKSADYEVSINAYVEDETGEKYYESIGAEFTITDGVIEAGVKGWN